MSGCDIVEEPGACVCCGTGLRDAEKDDGLCMPCRHAMVHSLKEGGIELCIYSSDEEAVKRCTGCGAGLCSSCGFTLDGSTYCNDCYDKAIAVV